MMLKCKIEKNVPLPRQSRTGSTFHADLIGFLKKLEVGNSALFQCEQHKAYILETKAHLTTRIYGIVTGREFTFKLDAERDTVRIWRTK